MLAASLRVRHWGCLTETLTGDARAAQISSDAAGDVLVMLGPDPARVDRFLLDVAATQASAPSVLSRSPTSVVLRVANPPGGVVARILASGCAIAWPVAYAEGRESYRLLAPTRGHVEAAVQRIREVGDVHLEQLTEIPNEALDITTTVGNLAGDLTQRQLAVLQAAVRAGYYASPRRASAEQLAAQLGVSTSTLTEHLRKAEGRLLERFAELLALAPILASAALRTEGRPRKRPDTKP